MNPGDYAPHRKVPPAMLRWGFRLGIDSEYPYRDQKLVEDWRNFPQTTNGAAIFIWLISVARAVLEIDV